MDENAILNLIKTTDEQNSFINLIENMLENTFKRTPEKDEELEHSPFLESISSAITFAIQKRNISNDRNGIEQFLESILTKAKEIPIMKITISFSPSEKLTISLKEWANKNISGNVIFNITTDPKILGGAVIMSKGEYSNYSLSDKIDKFFLTKKQEVLLLL